METQNTFFCSQCGAQNYGSAFCGKCGKSLSSFKAPFTDEMTSQKRYCPQCGSVNEPGSAFCSHCGSPITTAQYGQNAADAASAEAGRPVYVFQQQVVQPARSVAGNQNLPIKDRTTAALLAIFLGGFGIHKFYLNKNGAGILYLCFCWTGIPEIIGFIEGISYLCSSDEEFELKHQVRVK